VDTEARSLTPPVTAGPLPDEPAKPSSADATPAQAATDATEMGRLERWVRQRPVAAIGAALITLHLAIRASWAFDTWFAEDDFTWITNAFHEPLTWDLVTRDVAGHSLIGCWTVSWLITAIAPFERWPAAVIIVGLLAASAVLFWRLLRRLFGETPGVLVPLTLYLFWAMTTTTSIWWSNAILSLPLQICLCGALLAQLRYLHTRRVRDAVASTVILGVGLIFFSKAVVIPLVVFAFTVFYGFRGSPWRRFVQAIRVAWPVWLGHFLAVAAYTWLYLATVERWHRAPSSVGKVLDLAHNVIVTSFNTHVWGGPWSWGAKTSAQTAYAAPPEAMLWIAGALSLGVIAVSLCTGLRAHLAWALLLGYLLIDVAMLTSARLSFIGPHIGLADRYLSEVAVIGALVVGLAFLPLRGPGAPPDAPPPAPPVGPFNWFRQHSVVAKLAVGVAVAAVAVSGAISAQGLHDRWENHAGKKYVAELRADLRDYPGRPDMFETAVPAEVVSPIVNPANLLSRITRPFPEKPRFPTSTYGFVVPDNSGRLHEATVFGVSSRPGSAPMCGWRIQGETPTKIPLEKSVLAWQWVAKIAFYSSESTPADVTFGEQTTRVVLRPGLNELFVSVVGGGDSIRIGGVSEDAKVCVGQVVVGKPVARK
jgi:hypothetical protein